MHSPNNEQYPIVSQQSNRAARKPVTDNAKARTKKSRVPHPPHLYFERERERQRVSSSLKLRYERKFGEEAVFKQKLGHILILFF